jgi:hypothetical protein
MVPTPKVNLSLKLANLIIEQAWAIEKYFQEFHFSIIPLWPVFYEMRYAIEREWNVEDWGGGRK